MPPYNPAIAARLIRQCSYKAPRRVMIQRKTPSQSFSSTCSHQHNPSTGTVDPTELVGSPWPSRLLHLMNPLRHSFINSCLSSSPPPSQSMRYLDIGCGGGIFAESAARLPSTHSVTAIDPTPAVLAVAQRHQRRDPTLMAPGKLSYVNTSIEDFTRPKMASEGFDVVTLFEVLEHVNAPGPFLEQVLPHVKPGGWLVLSTIARTWTSWVVTNVMAEDVLGIVPKGTHEWGKYVNEEELRTWFGKQEGWGEAKSLGVMYVPGFGWREVKGGESWGNYFLGVRRNG
ncbi:S-adenosyl-L-methionine-dependent methyltransferase [Phaeosphaeriaceae sp. PMI808]|nr:S-adenosyl-L-methionine-dependent methyltransferase [Phaeosphaeriaceae sp. PMI808]